MRQKRPTARKKNCWVMKWAEQVGCFNSAAELNDALALLPTEEAPYKRRRRHA